MTRAGDSDPSDRLEHGLPQRHARAHRLHQGDAEDHQGHADGRGLEAAPRAGGRRGGASLCGAHGQGARQHRRQRSPTRPRRRSCWAAPAATRSICCSSAPAERGLCGPFNSAIVRLARERTNALMAEGKTVKILLRRPQGLRAAPPQLRAADHRGSSNCASCASSASTTPRRRREGHRALREGEFDVCTLFFSRFKSVIAQIPTAQQIIPPVFAESRAHGRRRTSTNTSPTRTRSWPNFCRATSPCRFSGRCWRTTPRSTARRCSAMDNATRNAGEMIRSRRSPTTAPARR